MAAKSTGAARRDPRRGAPVSLTQLTVIDAFRVWVVPAITAPVALVVYVLYNIEIIDRAPAVTGLGFVALALVLWAGLRGFISETTGRRLAGVLAGYAVLWAVGTTLPFMATVDPGPPLFSTQLHPEESTPLPLNGRPGTYRLVVNGSFTPNQTHGNRQAHYQLTLAGAETPQEVLEGDFIERYMQQRLGRRGSTTVRDLHTERQHEIRVPEGRALTVSLTSVSPPEVISAVTVQLYPERFPTIAFIAFAVLLTCGAILVDAWRPRDQGEGLMTTLTLAAVLSIASLAWMGGPHPGPGQFAVHAMLGGVTGTLAAMLLARLVQPLRHRLPAAP